MGIKRFGDFGNTQGYGAFQSLPEGGYVAKIMGASVHENSRGQYVKVSVDIAEGEFQGYYTRDYEGSRRRIRSGTVFIFPAYPTMTDPSRMVGQSASSRLLQTHLKIPIPVMRMTR